MVIDAPPSYDEDVQELVRLVDGLESAVFTCRCEGRYRVHMADALRDVLRRLRPAVAERLRREPEVADTRFSLLEVGE